MTRWIFTSFLIIFWVVSFGQDSVFGKYAKNYFQYPVGAKIGMVANLGELRTNHWHMGLDIRTEQTVNKPVYAAAEGYVAHIKVEPFGFGQAIYIAHPNGLTTLYAHLNKFFPALDAWVKEQQYAKQSWSVDIDVPPGLFRVKKGQFIANSGTTGGSGGPHVHFEIRNSETQECYNPLFFQVPFPDHTPPDLKRLAMYDRRKSVYEQSPLLYTLVKKSGSDYGLNIPQLTVQTPELSFAIEAYDRNDGSANQDGIYAARICIDDEPLDEFRLDSVSYDETRYMNAHIDYRYKARGGVYLQHLSKLPGYRGIVYHEINGDGVIQLTDTVIHDIEIEVLDSRKNKSTVRFKLKYNGKPDPVLVPDGEKFTPNYVNIFERPGFETYMTETSIYDTLHVSFKVDNTRPSNSVSPIYEFGDPKVPVHNYYKLRIQPDVETSEEERKHLVLVRKDGADEDVYACKWDLNTAVSSVRDFGNFQVFVDKEAPTVNDPGVGNPVNLTASRSIIFRPKDNYAVASLRVELDGNWLRFSNDKGRAWIYSFDEHFPRGTHELRVVVTDIGGNVTDKTWTVKR